MINSVYKAAIKYVENNILIKAYPYTFKCPIKVSLSRIS